MADAFLAMRQFKQHAADDTEVPKLIAGSWSEPNTRLPAATSYVPLLEGLSAGARADDL